MTIVGRKSCGIDGCQHHAIIRVQPFRKETWDFYCHEHWILLALNTVREAHESGYLSTKKPEPAEGHLTLVDSTPDTLV